MTNKRKRSSILKSSSIYQPFSGKLAKQVSFAETCHVLEFQKIGKAENSPASSINMSNVTQNDKMNDDKDTMQNISYADDCDTQNEMSISMINSDSNTSLAKNVESNNTISFTMNELTCEPNESDLCPKLSGEESNRSISILDSIYINRSDDCKELSMDCNVSLNDNDLVNVTEKIKSAKKSFSVDENNSIDMSSSNDIPMMQLNFHDVTNIGNNNDVSMNCNETNDFNNLTMIASDTIEIETNSFNMDDNKSIEIGCSNNVSMKHSYSQNISNCNKTNAEISMVSMGKNETMQISPEINHKSSKECTIQQCNTFNDISMDVAASDRSCFIKNENFDMKLSLINNDSGTCRATTNVSMNCNETNSFNMDDKSIQISCFNNMSMKDSYSQNISNCNKTNAEISMVSMGENETMQILPAINHKSSKECTVQKSNMYNDMSMDVSTSDKSCFIKDESVDMKLSLRNNDSGTCRATIDTAKYDNFINDTIVLKKLKKTDDCSNIFNESYVRNDASIMNVSNIDKTRIFKETFLKPIESINETKINTFVNENAEISHKVENESELDITNLDLPTLHELMTPKCSRIKTRFLLNSYTNQDNISDGYCFENIKFDEPDITDELILEAENRIKYKFDAISNIRSYDVEQFFSTKYLDTDVISIPEVLFIPEHSHLMESLPNFYEFEDDYIDNYEKKCLENYNEIIQIVENEMIKHEQIYNKRIQIEQDIKLDEEHLMQAIEKVEKLKLNGENLLRDIYAARENVFNIEDELERIGNTDESILEKCGKLQTLASDLSNLYDNSKFFTNKMNEIVITQSYLYPIHLIIDLDKLVVINIKQPIRTEKLCFTNTLVNRLLKIQISNPNLIQSICKSDENFYCVVGKLINHILCLENICDKIMNLMESDIPVTVFKDTKILIVLTNADEDNIIEINLDMEFLLYLNFPIKNNQQYVTLKSAYPTKNIKIVESFIVNTLNSLTLEEIVQFNFLKFSKDISCIF